MKFLKYALLIIALLVGAFFLIGLFSPSVDYQSQVQVNASAEKAWKTMSEDATMGEWLPGYQRSELVSGTANTVGAVSNVHFLEEGQAMIIKETITAFDANERIVMDFDMDFMTMEYEMIMDETDGKTTITTTTTAQGNGAFAKSMVALMKGSMKTQEDANLLSLKGAVEGR